MGSEKNCFRAISKGTLTPIAYNQVKIQSHDSHGRESLAQYILRSPFSQEKVTYRKETKTVLYRSKMNPNLKRNFSLFPVLDWIAEITAHIPNKGEQLVRYYGYYNWKPEVIEVDAPPDRGPPEKEITFDPSYNQLM